MYICFQGDHQRPVQSMLDCAKFSKWSRHHCVWLRWRPGSAIPSNSHTARVKLYSDIYHQDLLFVLCRRQGWGNIQWDPYSAVDVFRQQYPDVCNCAGSVQYPDVCIIMLGWMERFKHQWGAIASGILQSGGWANWWPNCLYYRPHNTYAFYVSLMAKVMCHVCHDVRHLTHEMAWLIWPDM